MTAPAGRPWRAVKRSARWALRGLIAAAAAVALYLTAAEIGMRIGVNSGADPTTGDIDVYFVSNGVHVDVRVPAVHGVKDWRPWLHPEVPVALNWYVSFGWGDEGFYTKVPEWKDLTLPVAVKGALWPTPSAVRAAALPTRPEPGDDVHRVRLDAQEYAALVGYIERTFELSPEGRPVMLDHPGYGWNDRFFRARGSYHLFRTCNGWTNGALAAAGQEAALWAPFERSVGWHLPKNRGQ